MVYKVTILNEFIQGVSIDRKKRKSNLWTWAHSNTKSWRKEEQLSKKTKKSDSKIEKLPLNPQEQQQNVEYSQEKVQEGGSNLLCHNDSI